MCLHFDAVILDFDFQSKPVTYKIIFRILKAKVVSILHIFICKIIYITICIKIMLYIFN